MGQFSWITSDTDQSVLCDGSVRSKMLSPDGRVFPEHNYEGYGVFDGKDYFELVAELNGKTTRQEGIDLLYQGENRNGIAAIAVSEYGVVLPKIVSIDAQGEFESYCESESCPEQGWRDHAEEEAETCSWCGENVDHCGCDEEEEYL